MIKQFTSAIGSQVIHYDDGHLIAIVDNVIIHPDTGKIEALWVVPAESEVKYGVLLVEDIIEWKTHIYVKNENVIAAPDEVIKIAEILSRKTPILGNRVQSESGERMGKVLNVDFDTEKWYLRYLYAQSSLLGIPLKSTIIHFDDILEVLPNLILVRDQGRKTTAISKDLIEDQQVLPAE